MDNILLIDFDMPHVRILSRYKSIFTFRNGIFLPVERILKKTNAKIIQYFHMEPKLEKIFCILNQWQSFSDSFPEIAAELRKRSNPKESLQQIKQFFEDIETFSSLDLDIIQSIDNVLDHIDFDLKYLSKDAYSYYPMEVQIIGSKNDVWIHPSVKASYGVVINAQKGPIVIDKNCSITPFTYIEGPFYAAENCHLDNVRITGGVILGKGCRVGGEIENSIFGNFSNKHHEGFVGHSIIGDWVNLGALTTTSDLKNNYGEVRLQIPISRIPQVHEALVTVSTNKIKFGSLIGDCVKTSIGTMLNTGTVLDVGCNVFGGSPPPYLQPFSWGLRGHKYELERFFKDCEKIFARRSQKMDPFFVELTRFYHSKSI